MSSSNCCFLTCIQVCREADQVMCYSHLFQNFSQFIVIHTVKGFGIVNKAERDVFLELSCLFHDPADVGNLISGSSAFSKTSLNIWKLASKDMNYLEISLTKNTEDLYTENYKTLLRKIKRLNKMEIYQAHGSEDLILLKYQFPPN